MNERELINKEIIELVTALSAPTSDIGDWKINKIYEYRMSGKEDPYDFEELVAKRQAARDRINELQASLATLEAAEGKEVVADAETASEN